MKKTHIMITSAAALVALVAVTGIAISVFAQDLTGTMERPFRMRFWEDLSENTQAEIQSLFQAKQEERQAKGEKINEALNQGYDAWAAAITEIMGENCPLLEQVTEENFEKFRTAHNYMEQAQDIFEEIGIERGFGHGGMRGMRGEMKGMGMHECNMAPGN